MNQEGYNEVLAALQRAGMSAYVAPMPAENEDWRFVSVSPVGEVAPVRTLNALGQLIVQPGQYTAEVGPQFIITDIDHRTGVVTLEDLLAPQYQQFPDPSAG